MDVLTPSSAFTRMAWRLALFCLALGAFAPARAQVSREYQLKAVLLWRFAQFVEWPTNAFENAESPIIIGILGKNPFGTAVEEVVADETAHNRKLFVRYFNRVEEITKCHLLYICPSEEGSVARITEALSSRPILTISEIENFTLRHGGMIRMLTDGNKVRFRINVAAATRSRLVMDPRLLRMAEIVRDK